MTLRVLIVDNDRQRAAAIDAFVRLEYGIEPLRSDGLDSLLHELARATVAQEDVRHVVILASDIPSETRKKLDSKLTAIFGQPSMMPDGHVIVLQRSGQQRLGIHSNQTDWLPVEPSRVEEAVLKAILDRVLQPMQLPNVVWDKGDLILAQQLAWLNPLGRQDGEKHILQRLLSRFRPTCRSAEILRLTPGYSGSLVFRVVWTDDGNHHESALMKVSKHEDLWKIRRTFENWGEIEEALVHSGLTRNSPNLLQPNMPATDSSFLVEVSGFYAEFWQFLGDKAGRFVDWEAVHWGEDIGLPPTEEFLEKTLQLLRSAWYDKAIWCDRKILWTQGDNDRNASMGWLPYGISARWKAKIVSSLTELDRLGKRLCERTWKDDCSIIRAWLSDGPAQSSVAAKEERVLISAIHGDLNKGNILWWVDGNRPLLIDFATYRSQAHTLQDFATLESQVTFALMDREHHSVHLGLDYADEQLEAWHQRLPFIVPDLPRKMEGVVPWHAKKDLFKGVVQAEVLIGLIRRHAHEVFTGAVRRTGQTSPEGRFCTEYAAALLFPTLKAIGYDNSLSPLKRLLAVRSATSLIGRLNAPIHASGSQ